MSKKWYVVHAYSGFEKSVQRALVERIRRSELQEQFGQILVPVEEVVEMKAGAKAISERKFFPGYVLVRMALNDETWSLVRNTAKVTGFLGPGGKPSPIPDHEADRIRSQIQEGVEHPKPTIAFISGDNVRVSDGPFASFNGVVEEVDEAKGRLKVSVSIFGRATPVELEYSQVEKL